jgi:hypothetical protein
VWEEDSPVSSEERTENTGERERQRSRNMSTTMKNKNKERENHLNIERQNGEETNE